MQRILDVIWMAFLAIVQRLSTGRDSVRDGAPHDDAVSAYLERFCNASRTPEWDTHMLSPARLAQAQVRLSEIAGTHFSASSAPRLRWTRVLSVRRALDRLLGLSWYARMLGGWRRQCLVVVGKPASGKSALAVQASQLLAMRAQARGRGLVPVYVNLTHFTSAYPLSKDGLLQLVARSIDHAGRRYLPVEPAWVSGELSQQARHLLDDPRWRLVVFLDGVDEMPVTDSDAGEHNQRLEAIAELVQSYAQHRFVITCRVADYVTLRDYNHDFQMGLYQIQPWTQPMFARYVAARASENIAGVAEIRASLQRAGNAEVWGHFADSPFLAALLFGGSQLERAGTLSAALWNFLVARLRSMFGPEPGYLAPLAELERFGFARTMDPSRRYPLPEAILAPACDGGLLNPADPNPEFAIKPLQSYLAARYLWRRIEHFPEAVYDLPFAHARLTFTFQIVSEIAGDSPAFACYLVKVAELTRDARRAAAFLTVCASCVKSSQLHANPALARSLIDVLERVLRSRDAGGMQRALEAVQRCPEILLIGGERSADLAWAIAIEGSEEGRRRLLRLLLARLEIVRAFHGPLRLVLLRFVQRASLTRELHQMMCCNADGRPRTGAAGRWLSVGLRVALALGAVAVLYAVYLLCLEAAHRLAGTGMSLATGSSDAMLHAVPDRLPDLGVRAALIAVLVAIPWIVVNWLARADLGFRSWRLRASTVLVVGISGRYLLLLPGIGATPAAAVSAVLEYIELAIVLVLPLLLPVLYMALVRRMRLRASLADDAAFGHGDEEHDGEVVFVSESELEPDAAAEPAASTEGYWAALRKKLRSHYEEVASHPVRFCVRLLVLLALSGGLILLSSRHVGWWRSVVATAGVVIGGLFARSVWIGSRAHRETRRRLAAALSALQVAPEEQLVQLLSLIADRSVPRRHRIAYIQLLEERVRWDRALLHRCQRLIRSRDFPGESRRALSEAIARKLPEVEQNSNPGWDKRKLDALFEKQPEPDDDVN